VYDAIRGIDTCKDAKPITFKKVKEFKEQKKAKEIEEGIKKEEAAAKIQKYLNIF